MLLAGLATAAVAVLLLTAAPAAVAVLAVAVVAAVEVLTAVGMMRTVGVVAGVLLLLLAVALPLAPLLLEPLLSSLSLAHARTPTCRHCPCTSSHP